MRQRANPLAQVLTRPCTASILRPIYSHADYVSCDLFVRLASHICQTSLTGLHFHNRVTIQSEYKQANQRGLNR